MNYKYNKAALEEEIDKISLTEFQRNNVNNHFHIVEKELNNMGFSNIQRQGSFGRGTVIKGQESDGFDLDIAVLLDKTNSIESNLWNYKIVEALKKHYWNKKITIDKKAVKTEVKSNFGIDVTQICRNDNGEELVFNSNTMQFDPSYALEFRNLFKTKNAKSNNALRDLARIYKHIRDAANDIKLKSLPLEISLYQSFATNVSDYGNSLFSTLRNVETLIRQLIKDNNFQYIKNPACSKDLIKTGIETIEEANNWLLLNTVVVKVLEGTLIHSKPFHSLKRKYQSLKEIDKIYSNTSIIQPNKTVITGGVFGGDDLDWNI